MENIGLNFMAIGTGGGGGNILPTSTNKEFKNNEILISA